jgi:hypothetical protein
MYCLGLVNSGGLFTLSSAIINHEPIRLGGYAFVVILMTNPS